MHREQFVDKHNQDNPCCKFYAMRFYIGSQMVFFYLWVHYLLLPGHPQACMLGQHLHHLQNLVLGFNQGWQSMREFHLVTNLCSLTDVNISPWKSWGCRWRYLATRGGWPTQHWLAPCLPPLQIPLEYFQVIRIWEQICYFETLMLNSRYFVTSWNFEGITSLGSVHMTLK